jgi:hypothetical protein
MSGTIAARFRFRGKGCWIARTAKFFHRTNLAARIANGANERSQIHHRVLKIARALPGNQFCRRFPYLSSARARIDWIANIEESGENAAGVCFDERQRLIESEHRNCVGSVAADSRQRFQLIRIARENAAEFYRN